MTQEVSRIGKNGEETTKIISYKLQLIDSARQAHYQILLMILLKESIKLDAKPT